LQKVNTNDATDSTKTSTILIDVLLSFLYIFLLKCVCKRLLNFILNAYY